MPLALAALSHRLQALSLLTDADSAQLLSPEQRQQLAHAALKAYRGGMQLVRVFWGLWLLPLGWLVLRSRRLPRLLGALLVLGGLGYVLDVLAELLVPGYADWWISAHLTLPASVGEIGTCLWLLLFGLRAARRDVVPFRCPLRRRLMQSRFPDRAVRSAAVAAPQAVGAVGQPDLLLPVR
ncbi:MAG: DUF4386 family protein [Stenotrophomonas sp.]